MAHLINTANENINCIYYLYSINDTVTVRMTKQLLKCNSDEYEESPRQPDLEVEEMLDELESHIHSSENTDAER